MSDSRGGRGSKRGSYIVETSILFPAFLIGLMLLLSIIPAIAAAEAEVFAAADQLKGADLRAAFVQSRPAEEIAMFVRLQQESAFDAVYIRRFQYLHSADGEEDLISVSFRGISGSGNPMGRISRIVFDGNVRSRAFTGAVYGGDGDPDAFSRNEESDPVYVFPARGERYHCRSCPFLNPASERTYLTAALRRRFRPCTICNSEACAIGDMVYCFYTDGEVYHVGTCPQVDKFYIVMEREDAIRKGYTPCGTCGG